MIRWIYYPLSVKPSGFVKSIVNVFEENSLLIDSSTHDHQPSDSVLAIVREGLECSGFKVEKGKKNSEKILVPVLFGMNGQVSK